MHSPYGDVLRIASAPAIETSSPCNTITPLVAMATIS